MNVNNRRHNINHSDWWLVTSNSICNLLIYRIWLKSFWKICNDQFLLQIFRKFCRSICYFFCRINLLRSRFLDEIDAYGMGSMSLEVETDSIENYHQRFKIVWLCLSLIIPINNMFIVYSFHFEGSFFDCCLSRIVFDSLELDNKHSKFEAFLGIITYLEPSLWNIFYDHVNNIFHHQRHHNIQCEKDMQNIKYTQNTIYTTRRIYIFDLFDIWSLWNSLKNNIK